tara:strand:- start:294 stop:602 length:309 start_codon:yes stop_codon:yes gene_type:complete
MANAYINAKANPSDTNVLTIYTCGQFTTAIVKSILVCNVNAADKTITVKLGSSFLFNAKTIAAGATVELLTAPLVVQADEVITVQSNVANDMHIVASILEVS